MSNIRDHYPKYQCTVYTCPKGIPSQLALRVCGAAGLNRHVPQISVHVFCLFSPPTHPAVRVYGPPPALRASKGFQGPGDTQRRDAEG